MALDLEAGRWEKIGRTDTTHFITLASTPWGMYVNNYMVVDLKTNKKYIFSSELKRKWESHIVRSTVNHELDIVFAFDSTVYFGDYASRLDSFEIRKQDLIESKD
jgi:hypothetical protein